MNNIIKRTWRQGSMVIIEDLRGLAFQAEENGHTFEISAIDRDGEPVALSGTPAGVMLRCDNQDVALTCAVSEGKVTATLPANAYEVPGRFALTIFLTSGGQKMAIYAAVGTVKKTNSGTVAPPAGDDVTDLISRINTAINAIPVNYNAAFAVAYENLTFPVKAGQYCIQNGALKKAIVDIPSSETYTAAHWESTNFGDELFSQKSAVNTIEDGLSTQLAADEISGTLTEAARIPVGCKFIKDKVYSIKVNFTTITESNFNILLSTTSGVAGVTETIGEYHAETGGSISVTFKPIADANYVLFYAQGIGTIQFDYKINSLNVPLVDKTLAVEGEAADAKETGKRAKSAKDIAMINLNVLTPTTEITSALAQNSGNQYVYFTDSPVPKGKYWFIIESNAAFSFTSLRFYRGTSYDIAISDGGQADQNNPFIYHLDYSAGTASIDRIRIYGVSAAVNVKIRFIEYEINHFGMANSIAGTGYVGNFVKNKADNTAWIDGKSVQVQSPFFIRTDSGYSILHLDVSKGDLIHIHFKNSSHIPGDTRYILSERIIYGDGADQSGFNGRYEGEYGRTEYIYVAEKDMKMTVCSETSYKPDVYQYDADMYANTADMIIRKYIRFPYNETTQKLSITKASFNGYDDPDPENIRPYPLTLLHFSDCHNNVVNISAVKEFIDVYGKYINDAICTGDLTGTTFADYLPLFAENGYKKILLSIGNHDVYDADGTHPEDYANRDYFATNLQKYEKYFEPNISEWDVVQPSDASTYGKCYYYKDYSSNGYGYRLIVLDAMAYDNDQHNWFVSVLADARTSEKTVVVAEHFPPYMGLADITPFNTPFMSKLTGMEHNYKLYLETNAGNALDAVDSFINGGGEFACWLCGHLHYDQVGTIATHPNQIFIAVASASYTAVWADQPRYKNTPSEDAFNIVSIDPFLKLIKVQRIGAVVDDWGRMHDHVTIDYETKTIVATS